MLQVDLASLKNMLEDLNIEILESLSWMSNDELSLDSWQGVIVARKKARI